MRISASMLALVCVAGAGCAGSQYCWYNPAKTQAEARQDCLECRDQAVAEASQAVAEYYYSPRVTSSVSSSPDPGLARGEVDRDALRGWTEWGQTYRENISRGCMRDKGYRRIRADELDASARRQALPVDIVAGPAAYPLFEGER